MYTEEEAKKKWCPFQRIDYSNDPHMKVSSGFCQASECMMWKWQSTYKDGNPQMEYEQDPKQKTENCPKKLEEIGSRRHDFAGDDWCKHCGVEIEHVERPDLRKGYCGLTR